MHFSMVPAELQGKIRPMKSEVETDRWDQRAGQSQATLACWGGQDQQIQNGPLESIEFKDKWWLLPKPCPGPGVKGQEEEHVWVEHRVCTDRWGSVHGVSLSLEQKFRCTYVPTESSGS